METFNNKIHSEFLNTNEKQNNKNRNKQKCF